MARSRNIKPGFFRNELLSECEPLTRLLFIGLWTLADKAGRLEYRAKRIKADLFPWDNCDVTVMTQSLVRYGFVETYAVDGITYLQIVNWSKHQHPHHTETDSVIPPPPKKNQQLALDNGVLTVTQPEANRAAPSDSLLLIPDSLIPDSPIPGDDGQRAESAAADQAEDPFEHAWAAYPARAGGNSKINARKAWAARLSQGCTPEEMIAGTKRYAAFVKATGKIGTEYVKQAATFYGPGMHFREPFEVTAKAASLPRHTDFDKREYKSGDL